MLDAPSSVLTTLFFSGAKRFVLRVISVVTVSSSYLKINLSVSGPPPADYKAAQNVHPPPAGLYTACLLRFFDPQCLAGNPDF
jgi:hypothetical protein